MISINNVTNLTISSNGSASSTIGWFEQAIGYISLLNIIFGVIGNVICFSVFVFTPELRNMSFVVYLTYCSLANILSLFEWNLNHYLSPMFGIRLEDFTLASCRITIFLQYFSLQISSYFLTWMSIDRFVSVIAMPGSLASRLPFSTAKTAHFWSLLTIVIIFGLNSHILILNGYYNAPKWRNMTLSNGTVLTYLYQKPGFNCGRYSPTFNLWPLWDIVHVYAYTIAPFTVMMLFNVLLVVKTLLPNKNLKTNMSASSKINQDKARLTRSILTINISFLVLTVPADIAFGYIPDPSKSFVWLYNLLDCFAFMHQSVLFINCYTTNKKFRLRITNFIEWFLPRQKSNRVHSMELSMQRTIRTRTKESI